VKLRFLGTGTSFGVPVIGCSCAVCTSADPRDKRTRHAALITSGDRHLLVDTPPELRLQLLAAGVDHIDGVWYTHDHADHTHGIDDLRVFSSRRGHVPAFAGPATASSLRHKFAYIFDADYRPPDGTTKPEVELTEIVDNTVMHVAGFDLLPLRVPHGDTSSYGFRVGEIGYITDGKFLPPDVIESLAGVRILVLNALWFGNPHPTHFNIEEAIAAAELVGAERTYLTHLTHRVLHKDLLARLPGGVLPAYDGLTIEL
jgi:phosphoribosyl 1,2-cyclic phosphate phosphodiesterase